MSDEIQDTTPVSLPGQTGLDAQPEQPVDLDRSTIDLALRLLVGLLAYGGEGAAQRLQEMQRTLDEDPSLWSSAPAGGEKTLTRRAWHLGVGLTRRGRKRLRKGIRRASDLSLRAARRVASVPGRPLRRPIDARLAQWRRQAILMELEGEIEEQKGKALAKGTLGALVLEIMDEVADNPELLAFVQDLLSSQGKGMATIVMDNTRSAALTADDAGDALLRWLLRRKPRRELPPSPVEGQRQTMYAPTARVEEGSPDA